MKKGFTMIELIFVIVILGILAAVALPRLASTSTDAKIASAEAYIGTLNRSVGPAMWSRSMRDGNGSVKSMTLSTYTEVPKGVVDVNLSQCLSPGTASSTSNSVGKFSTTALPIEELFYCVDGNSTSAPRFGFKVEANGDINVSVQSNKTN